mgnify:CR=1 FL=1
MVITDYDEPQEQPMPTQPQPGTHWERLRYLNDDSPEGEIIIEGRQNPQGAAPSVALFSPDFPVVPAGWFGIGN